MPLGFILRLLSDIAPKKRSMASAIVARSQAWTDELNRGREGQQRLPYFDSLEAHVYSVCQSMAACAGSATYIDHPRLSAESRWFADAVLAFRILLRVALALKDEGVEIDADQFTNRYAGSWMQLFGLSLEDAIRVVVSARHATLDIVTEFGNAKHQYHQEYSTWSQALDLFVIQYIETKTNKLDAAMETIHSGFFNGIFTQYYVARMLAGRPILGFGAPSANAV